MPEEESEELPSADHLHADDFEMSLHWWLLLWFCLHAEQKIQENETLDELFADLDQNGDLEIDFKEFIALIAMVTSACEELFVPNNS